MFERDYDFTTRAQGDYRLAHTDASQAIDQGDPSAAVYPNGKKLTYDFAGESRSRGVQVDIGAYEFEGIAADLATKNGGAASASVLVAGGALSISGIELENRSDFDSGPFLVRLYASTDGTIDDGDVLVGERYVASLRALESREIAVDDLNTSLVDPGKSYYFGWRIESDSDPTTGNNSGRLTGRTTFCSENSGAYPQSFTQTAIAVQEGCDFRIPFDSFESGKEYWIDAGSGRFERVEPGVGGEMWFSTAREGLASGEYDVEMKAVDPVAKRVVAKGSATLTVSAIPPRMESDVVLTADGRGLILNLTASTATGRPVSRWVVNWGDGATTEFDALGHALTAGHIYSDAGQNRTVTVTLYETATTKSGTTLAAYSSRTSAPAQTQSAFEEALLDDAFAGLFFEDDLE